MKSFELTTDLRTHLREIRAAGLSIALVPTMGNLHPGHLALLEAARKACDYVVVTIFVNPLQFGPQEDFSRYPRTLETDCQQLISADCDVLFIPAVNEIYPNGFDAHTLVSIPELSEIYCGASRPGHFNGVSTILNVLFNMVMPDAAFFGQKDYQQLLIIRKMVSDLCMPIDIRDIPIQREDNGLAMSSRNSYLSEEERSLAAGLYRALLNTRKAIESGERNFTNLEQSAILELEATGIKADYFTVCHAHTLLPATDYDHNLVILAAAFVGKTRLIDNITVNITA